MPRAARLVVPGVPHHVTQRGNRCQRTFFDEGDYALYLRLLKFWCARAGTSVWAWCLMPNHVHLVLVPEREDGLAAALAPLHRRYTWEINQREGWRGFLWQSRFASCPMDEAHLHACLRYVELNPVRAGLARRPEDWRWSSARAHLGLADDGLTDLEPAQARVDDWRRLLDSGLGESEHQAIRAGERTGRPLGGPAFLARLAAAAGRPLKPAPAR
jgi:putative transposase